MHVLRPPSTGSRPQRVLPVAVQARLSQRLSSQQGLEVQEKPSSCRGSSHAPPAQRSSGRVLNGAKLCPKTELSPRRGDAKVSLQGSVQQENISHSQAHQFTGSQREGCKLCHQRYGHFRQCRFGRHASKRTTVGHQANATGDKLIQRNIQRSPHTQYRQIQPQPPMTEWDALGSCWNLGAEGLSQAVLQVLGDLNDQAIHDRRLHIVHAQDGVVHGVAPSNCLTKGRRQHVTEACPFEPAMQNGRLRRTGRRETPVHGPRCERCVDRLDDGFLRRGRYPTHRTNVAHRWPFMSRRSWMSSFAVETMREDAW